VIGHYLLSLTEEQEDRVLTRHLVPGSGQCLMGAVADWKPVGHRYTAYSGPRAYWVPGDSIGHRFDALGERFGAHRVNNAIRNRILSNRAWRVLQGRPVEAVAPVTQ
jgi:hypothetical protein